VLAEALDVRDRELAARACLADVVLPAREREAVVDLLRRTAERGQRDVTRLLRGGDQLRREESVSERGRRRLVGLAEAVPAADHLAALAHIARRAGAQACGPYSGTLCDRDGDERRRDQDDQRDKTRAPPCHVRLLPSVHVLPPFEPHLSVPPVAARGAGRAGRIHRPSTDATRSPEMTIPARIAPPKTTYCIAADKPTISSICVRNVRASAATQVDVALASPPDRAAPAITTAAIGASRYAEPNVGSMLLDTPAR